VADSELRRRRRDFDFLDSRVEPSTNVGGDCLWAQIMTTATTHFPDSAPSSLDHALQLVSRDSVDGWIGRLVEDSGPGRAMRLEIEIPLSDGEGERILGLFLGDPRLSPDWEVGSHDGNGSS
jgi:hypothetical protein